MSGSDTELPWPDEAALVRVLERARARGYLGPGPVEPHLVHARGFAAVATAVLTRTPRRVVDLGSGGGLPGLVLAAAWPTARITLVDAAQRRAADLTAAAAELFGAGRVEVVEARAETLAQRPDRRERAELVTARSFATPAVTAEIATGFVAVGGWLVVSEPPEPDEVRWPASGLARLGFGAAEPWLEGGAHYVAIPKVERASADLPRTTRRLVKRPAW